MQFHVWTESQMNEFCNLLSPRNLWSFFILIKKFSFLEEQHLSLEKYMFQNHLFKGVIHSFLYMNFLTTAFCSTVEEEAYVNMCVHPFILYHPCFSTDAGPQ